MNQHYIQKAWLRHFASAKGLVCRMNKTTLNLEALPPRRAAAMENFQSSLAEVHDSQIELKGYRVVRKLLKTGATLSEDERTHFDRWVALHLSRSTRSRANLHEHGLSYDDARAPFLNQDTNTISSFKEVFVRKCPMSDEALLLSDNPMLFMGDTENFSR